MGIFNKNITYKIYSFLFLALVVAFPIHDKLAPPIISFIGINWILEFNFREKLRRIRSLGVSKYLLSFAILYILYLVGTLYSSHLHSQSGALFNLEVKMSLWVFPLLFTTIDFERFKPGFRSKMLYGFIVGCIISLILIFNKAVLSYFKGGSTDAFYYVQLAYPQHPSYLAMFFTFAIAVLLTWIFVHFNENTLKRNLAFLLILVFQLFIVMLSSKAGIVSVILLYLATIIYTLFHGGSDRNNKLIISGFLVILFLVTVSFFPRSYSRFYSAESALENEPNVHSQDGSVARVLVWQSALEIIREHPVFGVGTGDAEPELMKLYKQKNITLAIDETLNAHNQYLQTTISLGIIGLLILVAYFILPSLFAFRKKHLLYLLFLIIFAFNMLVESMLERQAGVVFYGLMNSFLFYFSYKGSGESGS